ncbi:hypothetical protein MSAN_02028300 [Mycena sanguinolenta]|uniref:Uncharacterized protein n=1 Tax=Mycena sanguinolenta TaxID=230812 RepID=A0A8H6XL89_9AGAR|nr:hypothetical protein MSAN_02028300 [Mycena sanguinolenta]
MAPFTSSLACLFIMAPLLAFSAPQTSHSTYSNRNSGRSPTYIAGLPTDTTHLALDDEAGEVIAFGRRGEQLGRFAFAPHTTDRRDAQVGACADMSSDDVQKLPGWNTLKTTAENNWGTGSYNVVTNDKNYPDSPAQSCVSTDVVSIVPDGNPSASQSCNTQSSQSGGKQVGTNGTIALTHSEGTSSTTTTTVTKQSSIAAGVSVAAEIGFPEIADVTSSFTFTSTFTNTLSTATETQSDQTSSATVTQSNVAGKTCYLEFTTQTCTITGSGQVRMLGTGWVWFEYNDKTQGHYKWALSIDATLTNQDDRSTFIDFRSTTGTTSTSNYTGVCM